MEQELQDVLSPGILFLALFILGEGCARGNCLMATQSQAKQMCPLHQFCLQEHFHLQPRSKRNSKAPDEASAERWG